MSDDSLDYNVGKVLEVSETWAGSEVTQDYASGSMVLEVYSTVDYSDQGGQVIIAGVVYPYNTKDEEASTVSLASALTADISQDEEVLVYPLAKVKEAMVQIDDEDADLIRVPQSLYDALPLGIRVIAEQETVLVSAYGDSEILDIVNQELLRSGEYTTPPDDNWNLTTTYDFDAAVAQINNDIAQTNADVAAGDTANSNAINAAVTDYTTKYNTVDQRVTDAITDYNAKIALKSKHTLSANAPTTSDAGNAGDVWERYSATDATKIIGRWRLMNSASPYSWQAMNLDATYIPQLDIGTGTFGDLTGTRLVSRSVAADRLLISDFTNYVRDGDMANLGTWSATSGAFGTGINYVTTSSGADGVPDKVIRFLPTGTALEIREAAFNVTPGDVFNMSAWFRRTGTVPTAGTCYLSLLFYDKDGVSLGTAVGNVLTFNATDVPGSPGGTFSGDVTVPAGAVTAIVGIRLSATVTSGAQIDVDRVRLRRKSGGELIVDGSVAARHVAANSMTTKQLLITDNTNLFADLASSGDRTNYPPGSGWDWALNLGGSENDKYRVKFTGGGALAYNQFFFGPQTNVEPGDQIFFSFDAFRENANYGTHVGFEGYQSDGTIVTYDLGISCVSTQTNGIWITITGSVTVPANVRLINPRFKVSSNAGTSTGNWYFRNVKVRRMAAGSLIVDGAILARHVTADMVEGLLVTGRVLQTSSLANRGIKISTSGLIGYNSSGQVTILIDPTTGALTTATGTGERITMRNDGTGGIIEAWTGVAGETQPSVFDPSLISGASPQLSIKSGATSTFVGRASIWLSSGYANGSTVNINTEFFDINTESGGNRFSVRSTGITTGLGFSAGSLTSNGEVHGGGAVRANENGAGAGLVDTTYNTGTTTGASINGNGRVVRTSTLKMKHSVKPMTYEEAHSVRRLISYTGKFKKDQYDDFEDVGTYPFFIAEQAAKEGVELWVARKHDVWKDEETGKYKVKRNPQGEPIAFRTGDVTVAHNYLINELFDRVEALESLAGK